MNILDNLNKKYLLLKDIIKNYGDMVLAYSGGKDSTLLLITGVEILGPEHVLAITAVSPIRRDREIKLASKLSKRFGVRHELIYTDEYKDRDFINNPDIRCIICKGKLFEHMKRLAEEKGFKNLIDGTNLNDSKEVRPTFEIARKYGIKWPLAEAGIGISDVESLLEQIGLTDYIQPHYSCSAWEIDLKALVKEEKGTDDSHS